MLYSFTFQESQTSEDEANEVYNFKAFKIPVVFNILITKFLPF